MVKRVRFGNKENAYPFIHTVDIQNGVHNSLMPHIDLILIFSFIKQIERRVWLFPNLIFISTYFANFIIPDHTTLGGRKLNWYACLYLGGEN